jgi:ankyrin repeat protein
VSIRINRSKPPLTEEKLRAFEERRGITLPEPYRRFLLQHNGGVPEPAHFTYLDEAGPYTDGKVTCFLAIHDGHHMSLEDAIQTFKIDEKRMPDRIFPIADDESGNQICISVAGPDTGVVYYWDHEHELEALADNPEDEPGDANLHKLADDFDHFLERLHGIDERPKQESQRVVEAGDVEKLRRMLDEGLPVNWANEDGWPLIGIAAGTDNPEMVKLLLDRGGDPVDAWKFSAGFGCNKVLKLLVRHGLTWDYLKFLLTTPETWEDLELVRLIFEHNGDPNGVVDSQKKHALAYAAASGNPEVVRMLIAFGAKGGTHDCWGIQAIHGAAATGNAEIMRILIDAGENPYTETAAHYKPPIKLIKDKALRKEIADYAAARGFFPPPRAKK